MNVTDVMSNQPITVGVDTVNNEQHYLVPAFELTVDELDEKLLSDAVDSLHLVAVEIDRSGLLANGALQEVERVALDDGVSKVIFDPAMFSSMVEQFTEKISKFRKDVVVVPAEDLSITTIDSEVDGEFLVNSFAVNIDELEESRSIPVGLSYGELTHYGILRKSGRYPWGSGSDSYQRSTSFLNQVSELRARGMSAKEIAENLSMTTTDLRTATAIATNQSRRANQAQAIRLKEKGYKNTKIAEIMKINESSVRSLLDESRRNRLDIMENTASALKKEMESHPLLDVGLGTDTAMGVSREKLQAAIGMMKDEGYQVFRFKTEQVGAPGKYTDIKVLAPPEMTYSEMYKMRDQIRPPRSFSEDGGVTMQTVQPMRSISAKNIQVVYGPDGGTKKDGVIELRRGVPEISLGENRYAQVRIAVDGKHYLKGMAIYADDLPDGVNVRFNTNKSDTGTKTDAFKSLKDDGEFPFGSVVRQQHYTDSKGKVQQSAINIVGSKEGSGVEGGWNWRESLSSQVLSKQPLSLAKTQLGLVRKAKQEEFDEIMAMTNPAVRQKLLKSFSDGCDSAAIKMKAAALPGQKVHVILPLDKMRPDQVYAPGYFNTGDKVVLIRHPHGGPFEIPELTVNNRVPEAKRLFGNLKDAVVINSSVAGRLSGADFDGDTVIVVPNRTRDGKKIIQTASPLKGLENFDPKDSYKAYHGMRTIDGGTYDEAKREVVYGPKGPSGKTMQTEMGKVSNLITDMTIKGAPSSDIARAVKHSMVVIDSEKHHLNWKQSEIDNGIRALKAKYQGGPDRGASTIVSRSSSETRINARKERPHGLGGPIDTKTGKKMYIDTDDSYTVTKVNKRTGVTVEELRNRQIKVARMSITDDAMSLTSGGKKSGGMPIERVYAEHANELKAMANKARLAMISQRPISRDPYSAISYSKEVASLSAKLRMAEENKPRERQAQLQARLAIQQKKAESSLDRSSVKKLEAVYLTQARAKAGAKKSLIEISDKEWEAIQAGAVSHSKLTKILNNANEERVKELASPRTPKTVTPGKKAQAAAMLSRGYSYAEVAKSLGISASTLASAMKEGG